jgi:hypothetical protein
MIDISRLAAMADPDSNPHFRRIWRESEFTPAELDRLSDHELSVGHAARAELLAWRAAALREARG